MTWLLLFGLGYLIGHIVYWFLFEFEEEYEEEIRRINNPFGAVTRDSYGTMILQGKKVAWNDSPEFYAAQCEVDDYLAEHK